MSPTVFTEKGYRFFFFSREESRPHVHVLSEDGEAKFWLEPEVEFAKNHGYRRQQLREIGAIVEEPHHEILLAWRRHFSS